MTDIRFLCCTERKTIVTGHYGSGKTEFSISLAMHLAAQSAQKIAVVDLDIVNPYFRSREQRKLLEGVGISVYGSCFEDEITAELPAIGAQIRTPLEDSQCRVIIDLGGNDVGALVLNQFSKYFLTDTTVLAVVNASRPETGTLSGALAHIKAIENAAGLSVTGIVNNTHMLSDTTAKTVKKGYDLCMSICENTGLKLFFNCYPDGKVNPDDLMTLSGTLLPIGLYLRPTWLD